MISINSFYETIFYSITYILSPFSTNHIPSCLGSRVDIISNLNLVFMIFALSSITTLLHSVINSAINVLTNYGARSAIVELPLPPIVSQALDCRLPDAEANSDRPGVSSI
jgi:hypothetical protein